MKGCRLCFRDIELGELRDAGGLAGTSGARRGAPAEGSAVAATTPHPQEVAHTTATASSLPEVSCPLPIEPCP